MTTKELLTIEFRYKDINKNDGSTDHKSKTVTLGVYDTFEEAAEAGNKMLELMESRFNLHTYPDGRKATKERFSKNGGSFGSSKKLITNMAYLTTPFEFYAKIKTLKYDDINSTIDEAMTAEKRYKNS